VFFGGFTAEKHPKISYSPPSQWEGGQGGMGKDTFYLRGLRVKISAKEKA
jgi:hypothetical protein